jgi:hypothetical protein
VCHQRTTSSPSQLEGFSGPGPRPELLAELLRGSSERMYNGSAVQHGKVSSSQRSRHCSPCSRPWGWSQAFAHAVICMTDVPLRLRTEA